MLPHKHYSVDAIQTVLDGAKPDCPAEESTMNRWKASFRKMKSRIEAMLIALWIWEHSKPYPLFSAGSLLDAIKSTDGCWLKSVTYRLVNSGYIQHTQFAFCP